MSLPAEGSFGEEEAMDVRFGGREEAEAEAEAEDEMRTGLKIDVRMGIEDRVALDWTDDAGVREARRRRGLIQLGACIVVVLIVVVALIGAVALALSPPA